MPSVCAYFPFHLGIRRGVASLIASKMHHDMGQAYESFSCQVPSSSKTASLRNQINTISQKEDEVLYEAWE